MSPLVAKGLSKEIQEAAQRKTLNDVISCHYAERRALSPFEGRRATSLLWENFAT
jgi:hypothetical protein